MGFSHRVLVVKQVLLHLFAFKLCLKIYSCVFIFTGECVCTMDINSIPPEVLTKIFSYLSQFDLLTHINTVCHYWNEVAFSSSLWKTINIEYCNDDIVYLYLQNIAHYRDLVQNLMIDSSDLMKFIDIRKNQNLSNLRNLQIQNYPPHEDLYSNIVDAYPGIVAIKCSISKSVDLSILSNLQFRDFEINMLTEWNKIVLNKRICEFISKQCSLQSLSIHCLSLESETIIKLLRNLTDLTCLDLSGSTGVDGCVFTALPELSKLTALDLSYTTVNDECLKNIATKASQLKTLTLKGCDTYSDIGIAYIADDCHCLERLVIKYYQDIQDARLFPSTLESLGKGCQKLKYLFMEDRIGLDDSGVISLVQNCHDLEYLVLIIKNISSPSLHAISHFCSNLFHLEIYGYDFNAVSVESLLTKNRCIKYVSIGNCSNIDAIDLCKSNETKSVILKTHSRAIELKICGKTRIGYSAIEQIVTFCPDLRSLYLPPINTPVHDDVIEIAFGKCRFLKTLFLDTEIIFRESLK